MAATKEAILAKQHEPDLDVTIFFLDLRAFGKDFDRYCERAKAQGIRYVRSFISRTYEMPDTRSIRLVYAAPVGSACRAELSGQGAASGAVENAGQSQIPPGGRDLQQVEEEFDMVVLSLGL